MPTQALPEGARLIPPVVGQVSMRIAQGERLIDGFGMPDQKDLHPPSVATRGIPVNPPMSPMSPMSPAGAL